MFYKYLLILVTIVSANTIVYASEENRHTCSGHEKDTSLQTGVPMMSGRTQPHTHLEYIVYYQPVISYSNIKQPQSNKFYATRAPLETMYFRKQYQFHGNYQCACCSKSKL